jgi:hypothetical protein
METAHVGQRVRYIGGDHDGCIGTVAYVTHIRNTSIPDYDRLEVNIDIIPATVEAEHGRVHTLEAAARFFQAQSPTFKI